MHYNFTGKNIINNAVFSYASFITFIYYLYKNNEAIFFRNILMFIINASVVK